MAKFGAVFNSDVKKTDSRPRSETKWIHYTKLIDNTDQYRKSATEEDIAAFAELIKTITVDNGTEFADCEGIEKKIKKERNVQKFITAILTAVLSEAQTRIRTG